MGVHRPRSGHSIGSHALPSDGPRGIPLAADWDDSGWTHGAHARGPVFQVSSHTDEHPGHSRRPRVRRDVRVMCGAIQPPIKCPPVVASVDNVSVTSSRMARAVRQAGMPTVSCSEPLWNLRTRRDNCELSLHFRRLQPEQPTVPVLRSAPHRRVHPLAALAFRAAVAQLRGACAHRAVRDVVEHARWKRV